MTAHTLRLAEADHYAVGIAALQVALAKARRENLKPPPKLTLSQWAERYAVLSKETSAQTGRFRAFAYQRGIMDAITDPSVTTVTVRKSARIGYTKILDHVVGYYIHQDPAAILAVQPRVEDAEDYSSTELAPMLRDTPVLAAIAGDARARDSGNTILKKLFRNGASVRLVGANSPGGFRRITARIILFDEVDGYPISGAGVEGDQIALGKKRSETFWNRKIVIGSTPTIKGLSRIDDSYEESDQRRFHVRCPHCDGLQVLDWGGPHTPHGIKWDKDENGVGLPDTVHYVCSISGCVIDEADKEEMIETAEANGGGWIAGKPFAGHAGFAINTLYSLFPNATWRLLVKEWLEVKDDPLKRKTFINLVLGEAYEDRGEQALNEARLLARCEVWNAEVPDGVAVLSAGVDVQLDRIEVEVVGWGRNEESWSVDYTILEGDPGEPAVWAELDKHLKRIWRRADGRGFEIMAACVDTGGAHTQMSYAFCKERLGRRIWGIKGESAQGGQRSPVWPIKKPTRRTKASFRPVILGVNAAKDSIRSRMHLDAPGPGYMHYPADRDLNYFGQMTAERSVVKVSAGRRYRIWEQLPGRANEALDCRVYAFGALCGLFHFGLKLNRRADDVGARLTPAEIIPATASAVDSGSSLGDAAAPPAAAPATVVGPGASSAPRAAAAKRSLGSLLPK